MEKIPQEIQTYPENSVDPQQYDTDSPLSYTDAEGGKIHVHAWLRWPDYDMIFGTPVSDNPSRAKEFGYFAFRRKQPDGSMRVWRIYLDQLELEELAENFNLLLAISQGQRPEEWKKYKNTSPKSHENTNL